MRYKRRIERTTRKINDTFNRIDTMRRERLNLPFVAFVALMPYMTEQTIKSLVLIPPPKKLKKADIPDSLQLATFGDLVKLQGVAKNEGDYLRLCCRLVEALTGINSDIVGSCRAYDVLGIVNMIQGEMERIGKLFQGLNAEHTAEEINAGIDKLEFGTFGLVDYYAKRMGIVDHEEVFKTPWARIYKCMQIDFENNEFEKRYRKVLEQKTKIKRR